MVWTYNDIKGIIWHVTVALIFIIVVYNVTKD